MSLFITKINDATTSVSYEYLESEHVFCYVVDATYTFSILNVEFTDGQDSLLEGIEALKTAYLRKNIAAKIGTDEFKNGLVTNVSLPKSDRVNRTSASITIQERIRPENDGVLSELFDNLPSPQDIEAFQEDLSFSRGDDSYSYGRNISIKYKQDTADQFVTNVKTFVRNIYLGSRPLYGFQTDGISENARFSLNLKSKISESYDEINKEFKFSENFDSNQIQTLGGLPFSTKTTYDISLNDDGYSTKSYSAEINALSEPLEVNVISGLKLFLQDILDNNTGTYGNPTDIEKLVKSDDGFASLSLSFTNDPRANSINNIEYVAKKSNDGSFNKYDFDLNISSKGKNHVVAFNNALTFFSGNRNIAYSKIPILFSEITSGQMNEISRNVSFNPFQKSISENVSFSTNPDYVDNGDGIFKRSVSISDQNPVGRNSVIPIFGFKEIIVKNEDGKTLGSRTSSAEISSASPSIENDCLLISSGEIPNYTYNYMTAKKTSFEPLKGVCSAVIDFNFFN